jgi:hypothetical protein
MLAITLFEIDYPSSFSNWLDAYLNTSNTQKEVAVCSENAAELLAIINQKCIPNFFLLVNNKESNVPFLKMRFKHQKTLFYVVNKIRALRLHRV